MPAMLLLLLGLGAVAAQPLRTIVVAAPEAAPLERLAAQELRRYWHARSGALPTIGSDTALLGDARGELLGEAVTGRQTDTSSIAMSPRELEPRKASKVKLAVGRAIFAKCQSVP